MNIDFTEIPPANKGGKDQDLFELFACDFLESLGYEIVERPSRGPDGKKDFIVLSKTEPGKTSSTQMKWLVSCKHHAHSDTGVSDKHELDIPDRVIKHKCHGFLGFYSTIANSTLSQKLKLFEDRFVSTIYDHSRIENEIHSIKEKERILSTYFPESAEQWKAQSKEYAKTEDKNTDSAFQFSRNDLLDISRTAQIQIELAKLKYEFDFTWNKSEEQLSQMLDYVDFANETIANQIFDFLQHSVSHHTRNKMPSEIARSIQTLIFSYFPSSYDEKEIKLRITNGKKCVDTAFNLIYDSMIYSGNYYVAYTGLCIWKNIYLNSTRNNYSELKELIKEQYREIEETLKRPERDDLGDAQELVRIFKEDLKNKSVRYPLLPNNLFRLVFGNNMSNL